MLHIPTDTTAQSLVVLVAKINYLNFFSNSDEKNRKLHDFGRYNYVGGL